MRSPGLRIDDYALDARTHLIEAEGQIDLYAAPGLKERALEVAERGRQDLIVDLSRVDFIDSAGLGALLDVLRRLQREESTLSLVVTDYDIERLLKITELDQSFAIHRSRAEAQQALEKPPVE